MSSIQIRGTRLWLDDGRSVVLMNSKIYLVTESQETLLFLRTDKIVTDAWFATRKLHYYWTVELRGEIGSYQSLALRGPEAFQIIEDFELAKSKEKAISDLVEADLIYK